MKVKIEFMEYLHHCKSLKFEEEPDYEFLRKTLRKMQYSYKNVWEP